MSWSGSFRRTRLRNGLRRSAAYDALRDPMSRLHTRLLHPCAQRDSLYTLAEELRGRLKTARFPLSVLASWADPS